MGILNVTPDSFSDGGAFDTVDLALERASEMIAQGVDIIDIGPESTRPGSQPVSPADQIARCVPVIESIRGTYPSVPISIDTRLADVAHAAIESGAHWINDVSALRDDSAMIKLAARSAAPLVLMHRRGTSADMQRGGGPQYENVIAEIVDFLRERRNFAIQRGVAPQRIVLDPGIGFGKKTEANILILKNLRAFLELGNPVMLGASRKNFLGEITGGTNPKDRDPASVACCVVALLAHQQQQPGAAPLILRVHDVEGSRQALQLCDAMRKTKPLDQV
jgi:dihydropteroate synthase